MKKSENVFNEFIESNPKFSLLNESNNSYITIKNTVTVSEVELLLNKLWDEKIEITFHDTIHPTTSDPGAYFSYSTEKSNSKNIWSMTYGNHGWSGGIYHIKSQTIARQISNIIQKTNTNKIQITNVCFFSNYKIESKKNSIKKDSEIFEVHYKS